MTPILIAVTGGSGAGKSWLASQLAAALAPDAACLSQDCFYRDRSHLPPTRRARINFDHPRSLDWANFESTLESLRAGKPADVPVYDFTSHARAGQPTRLKPAKFVLVEGLWLLLRRRVRAKFDFTIFIQCPARTRLERRLTRDAASRGRVPHSVLQQFRTTVQPMHRLFIEPQKAYADLVLGGDIPQGWVLKLAERLRDIQPGVR